MGLCVKCRTKQSKNKNNKCLDCSRKYYKQFYARRKKLGLCIKCHVSHNSSRLLCDICSDKALLSQSDRRIKAKKNFCCVACGDETDGQHTECNNCRQKRNDGFIEMSEKRHAEGVCGQCGQNDPKEGLKTCVQCLEKSRESYKNGTKHKRQQHHRQIKLIVFDHYGHKCVCCGENILMLLNIDHINNDGREHRKKLGNTARIYADIIENNFPQKYQILCYNCNIGKYYNGGICPHKNLEYGDNQIVLDRKRKLVVGV